LFGDAVRKEKKPALEINLNLVPLLESLGLGEAVDKLIESIRKGKTDILDALVTKIQRGEAEVKVSVGRKKKRIPIVLSIRFKK
jgi:hypothetical protein